MPNHAIIIPKWAMCAPQTPFPALWWATAPCRPTSPRDQADWLVDDGNGMDGPRINGNYTEFQQHSATQWEEKLFFSQVLYWEGASWKGPVFVLPNLWRAMGCPADIHLVDSIALPKLSMIQKGLVKPPQLVTVNHADIPTCLIELWNTSQLWQYGEWFINMDLPYNPVEESTHFWCSMFFATCRAKYSSNWRVIKYPWWSLMFQDWGHLSHTMCQHTQAVASQNATVRRLQRGT